MMAVAGAQCPPGGTPRLHGGPEGPPLRGNAGLLPLVGNSRN